jgi:hypothetical protein
MDAWRERMFLSAVGFLLTFAITRGVRHAIRAHVGPFRNLGGGGFHRHHLVFGILILLGAGYPWPMQIGAGADGNRTWLSAATAILYGIGSALTLDEFALWPRLADVYWARQGRESIDAVVLFGSLLWTGFWGGPFLHAFTRHVFRRR